MSTPREWTVFGGMDVTGKERLHVDGEVPLVFERVRVIEYSAFALQSKILEDLMGALNNAPSMDTETFENIGTPFRNDFDTWTAVTRELLSRLTKKDEQK